MTRPASALALLLFLSSFGPQGSPPSMESARRLIDRERWDQAALAYGAITAADPENGEAWFLLAWANHARGDYGAAAEANERAAAFPRWRTTAFFNLACARSLLGELDAAAEAIERARAAGFLDFDLLKNDPDLAALRARDPIELPARHEYQELRAHNGVVVPYLVQLPKGYDPKQSYPALLAFSPGRGGPAATDWALETLWGEAAAESGWIVVHPVAPERGWINHPAHHALNDLMKRVRKEHSIEGKKFHLFGFGGGCAPATTFARMSSSYFQSLTVVSSREWADWDDSGLRRFRSFPVQQIVGAEDAYGRAEAERVAAVFAERGVEGSLTVIPGEGVLVPSLRGTELLDAIAERVWSKDD